jgi:RNA polymerase sigma-70 factor, ECF subfamily
VSPSDSATHLLTRITNGDRAAGDRLAALVYDELRRIAARYLRRERANHTLQPTAVVHEAYIRLAGQQADWRNIAHFKAVAALQMSRVLRDYARKRNSIKGGGRVIKVSLDSSGPWTGRLRNGLEAALGVRPQRTATALALEDALNELAKGHPRQAEVACMRFYSASTEQEVSEALKLPLSTIQRDWIFAKAWLKKELG